MLDPFINLLTALSEPVEIAALIGVVTSWLVVIWPAYQNSSDKFKRWFFIVGGAIIAFGSAVLKVFFTQPPETVTLAILIQVGIQALPVWITYIVIPPANFLFFLQSKKHPKKS
jgi:hypothetical protein